MLHASIPASLRLGPPAARRPAPPRAVHCLRGSALRAVARPRKLGQREGGGQLILAGHSLPRRPAAPTASLRSQLAALLHICPIGSALRAPRSALREISERRRRERRPPAEPTIPVRRGMRGGGSERELGEVSL